MGKARVVIVAAALGAFLLVGCTGAAETVADATAAAEDAVEGAVGGAIEDGVEQMIEDQAEKDGATIDVDIDGDGDVAVPDTWPAQVPVPAGDVVLATRIEGGHSLAVKAASAEVAQAYVDSLVAAGFSMVSETVMDDGGFRLLEGDGLMISIAWTGGDDVLLSVDIRPSE